MKGTPYKHMYSGRCRVQSEFHIYYCSTCTYIVLATSCGTGLTKLVKVGNKGMRSAKRSCGTIQCVATEASENMESCADDCPLCCNVLDKLSCGVV